MAPRNQLTPTESQVATLVWQGLTNKEIAVTLNTSEQVIKNYLRSTFDKLGVWSRLELAMYIAQHGGDHWPRTAPVMVGGEGPVPQSGSPTAPPTSPLTA